ncbi:MAG: hypothetical protein ACP5GZ_04620 [Vulcanisaeta sp.]|uniref:hypothetical protein n=1 Tax=Vulcanisaeta sp. TaxID=2020871 RepID=UPI003D0ED9FE
MNKHSLSPMVLPLGVTLVLLMSIAITHAEAGVVTSQINNGIREALEKCKVNPYTVSITSITPTIQNNTVIIDATLSNNYNLEITMNLTNKLIPINDINVVVMNRNSIICGSSNITISNPSTNYSNTIVKANHFIEIISYTGSSPMTTSSTNTVVVYGTSISSVIVILNMTAYTGNIVCSTGSPLTPIYIVAPSRSIPLMYIIQPSRPITSLLCRYSQTLGSSYLLMAILIGIAAALLYEAVLIIVRMNHLKNT